MSKLPGALLAVAVLMAVASQPSMGNEVTLVFPPPRDAVLMVNDRFVAVHDSVERDAWPDSVTLKVRVNGAAPDPQLVQNEIGALGAAGISKDAITTDMAPQGIVYGFSIEIHPVDEKRYAEIQERVTDAIQRFDMSATGVVVSVNTCALRDEAVAALASRLEGEASSVARLVRVRIANRRDVDISTTRATRDRAYRCGASPMPAMLGPASFPDTLPQYRVIADGGAVFNLLGDTPDVGKLGGTTGSLAPGANIPREFIPFRAGVVTPQAFVESTGAYTALFHGKVDAALVVATIVPAKRDLGAKALATLFRTGVRAKDAYRDGSTVAFRTRDSKSAGRALAAIANIVTGARVVPYVSDCAAFHAEVVSSAIGIARGRAVVISHGSGNTLSNAFAIVVEHDMHQGVCGFGSGTSMSYLVDEFHKAAAAYDPGWEKFAARGAEFSTVVRLSTLASRVAHEVPHPRANGMGSASLASNPTFADCYAASNRALELAVANLVANFAPGKPRGIVDNSETWRPDGACSIYQSLEHYGDADSRSVTDTLVGMP